MLYDGAIRLFGYSQESLSNADSGYNRGNVEQSGNVYIHHYVDMEPIWTGSGSVS